MKKIVLLLAIMILPFICFAKTYQIDDINLKINIPDNYIVLTRDNLKDNAEMKELGINEEYMTNTMNINNIYMDILAQDLSYEILVMVPKITLTINNLSNLNDNLLNEVLNATKEKVHADKGSIYKSKYNFAVVEYYDSNMKYNIVNYYTVVNAKGYNFQLQHMGNIKEEDKLALKEIVDSVDIKVLDEYKNESSNTQDIINKSSKSTFNWKRVIIGTIVGGVIGGLGSILGLIIKKRKNKTSE